MTTFSIDTDNKITAFTAVEQIPEGHDRFATQKEFAKLSSDWQITRLVDVWNTFAGVAPFDTLKPLKKFTDRKTATTRIWAAIQKLDEDLLRARIRDAEAKLKAARTATASAKITTTEEPAVAHVAPNKTKATKEPTALTSSPTPRQGSKTAIVLDMMKRPQGATLAEIMSATAWQAHSIRGFISGCLTKKMSLTVESTKNQAGERTYRIAT